MPQRNAALTIYFCGQSRGGVKGITSLRIFRGTVCQEKFAGCGGGRQRARSSL